jgi:hypothetical protein
MDSHLTSESQIPPFIHRFQDEKEELGEGSNWVDNYWSFSGIVECACDELSFDEIVTHHHQAAPGFIHGWTWFQEWLILKGSNTEIYKHTGVAEVEYIDNGQAQIIRTRR